MARAMNRRDFLVTAGMGTAALTLPLGMFGAKDSKPTRPNFIFMVTDDQRWDALGVVQREMGDRARFPWVKTPNLDRIATAGVRFRNAFVVNSLCAPSRACFLSGQYNHVNGVANNHTPFPAGNATWAQQLRSAGYSNGYFGKWHMGSQPERPGFDSVASYIGQGKFEGCTFLVNGEKIEAKGWVDDVATDYALDFIRANKAKPFGMVLGFKSPHEPRTAPPRSKDLYAGMVPRPPVNASAVPPYGAKASSAAGDAEDVRKYFRCISAVDDNVGRVLTLLDELGLANNTVVVFCGDNGFYLGEHSLGDKRTAYDESLRIPLLVRYPGLVPKGKVVDDMALNIDMAPTFLDLAGVAVPAEMQGRSWRPLLEGKTAEWRNAFFYEYFLESAYPHVPSVLAVRTKTAKLIKYPDHDEWTELYNLEKDPHEMVNLARDPANKEFLAQMQAEFDKQAKAVNFSVPPYADKPGDQPAKVKRPQAGKKAQNNKEAK